MRMLPLFKANRIKGKILLLTLSVTLFFPSLALGSATEITIAGYGWGHGVGLCQWGAKGMAEAGFTYDQILSHYYRGTTIQDGNPVQKIKIGILTGQTEIQLSSPGGLNIESADQVLTVAGPNEIFKVRLSGIQYQLITPDGFTFGTYVYPIKFTPLSDNISLPQKSSYKRYRGSMIAQITSNGLTAINELPIEEYLYGVVPSEMPYGWPKEALKAQACAARNYAIKNMGKHGSYDLCATTHCQVYLGLDHEKASSTTAVNETAGKIIFFEGTPITAYYHSTCGGSTENSENVWRNALGYLKAVGCPYCVPSPHRGWSLTLARSELQAKLNANPETAVLGDLTGIQIAALRGERRVGSVKISGSGGDKEVLASKFREVLGTGSLKSTWFNISGAGYPAERSLATMVIGEAGYKLNDVFTKTDVAPYIKNGRTYVPVRYLANAIGIGDGGIEWYSSSRTARLTKGADIVSLIIGSRRLLKNTNPISMDVAPEISGSGRTMLPARWVAEAFGANVDWDAVSKTITVTY